MTYKAPDRAEQAVTITATGRGCTATIVLEVSEPNEVRMERAPSSLGNHKRLKVSAGFLADVYILPADVSF